MSDAAPSILETAPPPDLALRRRQVLALAFSLALATRLPYFVNLAVPLNDGGMFAQIVDEIRAAGLRLPTHTNYNQLHLPLSYPPLAFLLAAATGMVTGASSDDILKWLPLLLNLGSIAVFFALAQRLMPNRLALGIACSTFAILPQTAGWLVMGGGLTRSLGFLLSLSTLVFAYDALKEGRRRDILLTGLCAGLAGLSHLESGTLLAVVLPLFALYFERPRVSLSRLFPAALIAVMVAAPWLLWLSTTVGFEPLRNASRTGGRNLLGSLGMFFGGQLLTDRYMGLGALLLPGMLITVWRKQWLWTAWIFVIVMAVARSSYTQVAVPACLLLGIVGAEIAQEAQARRRLSRLTAPVLFGGWIAIIVGLGVWSAIDKYIYGSPVPSRKFDVLAALSKPEKKAMRWCRTHTPPNARFLVLNERMDNWYMDMAGEWFPYYAQRHSALTVQGREWQPKDEFARWQDYLNVAAGVPRLKQLESMLALEGIQYDHVLVIGPFYNPRATLAREFSRNPDFEVIYDKGTIRIYRAKSLRPALSSPR